MQKLHYEILKKFFNTWKIKYIGQVKYEINAQMAITTITDVMEDKLIINKAKFLYLLKQR